MSSNTKQRTGQLIPASGKGRVRPGAPAGRSDDERAAVRRRNDAKTREKVRRRHRRDLDRLAQALRKAWDLDGHGAAAGGSVAQAIGTLTRATKDLHVMERDAYDLGGGSRTVERVILLPVPASSMAEWEASSRQLLGIEGDQGGPVEAPRPGYRQVEAETVGEEGDG